MNAQSISRECGDALSAESFWSVSQRLREYDGSEIFISEYHDPNKFHFSLDRREAFRFVLQTHLTINLMIVLFSIERAARPWPQARVGAIQQRFVGAPRPGARPDHRPLAVGCLLQCSGVSRIEPFVSDTQRST